MNSRLSRTLLPASPALLLSAGAAALACVVMIDSVLSTDSSGHYLIAIGLLSFAVVCAAIWLRKDFDPLEPITLVAITTLIGFDRLRTIRAWRAARVSRC